jgi:PPOX class probable F420-dependent enzyme
MGNADIANIGRLSDRFREEVVVWLTTVTPKGQPQSVPVWFVWDGASFLIYSQPDKPKLRNIDTNPSVNLHLRGTESGSEVVIVEGRARRDPDHPPADRVADYVEKYRGEIDHLGWTPQSFAADYREPIRVFPTALRTW